MPKIFFLLLACNIHQRIPITTHLPDVIRCQFRKFAAALLGPVHFLSPDQQSGVHCLITCTIQLLTPNNLGGTWRRICLPDIRNVSALEVLRNCALQIDIYLLIHLLPVTWLHKTIRDTHLSLSNNQPCPGLLWPPRLQTYDNDYATAAATHLKLPGADELLPVLWWVL